MSSRHLVCIASNLIIDIIGSLQLPYLTQNLYFFQIKFVQLIFET